MLTWLTSLVSHRCYLYLELFSVDKLLPAKHSHKESPCPSHLGILLHPCNADETSEICWPKAVSFPQSHICGKLWGILTACGFAEGHFLQEQARAVKEAAVYVSMLRRLGKGHGTPLSFVNNVESIFTFHRRDGVSRCLPLPLIQTQIIWIGGCQHVCYAFAKGHHQRSLEACVYSFDKHFWSICKAILVF